MEQSVLVVLPPAARRCVADIEAAIGGAGLVFEPFEAAPGEHIPLRRLRTCHAAIIYGKLPLAAWTAGLMENCRILVRSPDGLAGTDVRSFGAWGIPVCVTPGDAHTDTGHPRAARIRAILQRVEAARTVALYLRDGFVRDCVNARWLRLDALRVPARAAADRPGHPVPGPARAPRALEGRGAGTHRGAADLARRAHAGAE